MRETELRRILYVITCCLVTTATSPPLLSSAPDWPASSLLFPPQGTSFSSLYSSRWFVKIRMYKKEESVRYDSYVCYDNSSPLAYEEHTVLRHLRLLYRFSLEFITTHDTSKLARFFEAFIFRVRPTFKGEIKSNTGSSS